MNSGGVAANPLPLYPFTAVVGCEKLKLALSLVVINSQLSGLLIAGPRGSAKSTLARGLANIMGLQVEVPGGGHSEGAPSSESDLPRFVTLPLGASSERVTGGLHLQEALQHGQVDALPGLLSRAHGGVLYVDEVNLLPDQLADLLLDSAVLGVHYMERDGLSRVDKSKFLLLATMNPEEGELRPQLLDRFALYCNCDKPLEMDERIEAVRRWQAFTEDAMGFCAEYVAQQQELQQQLAQAKTRLPKVKVPVASRSEIARYCASSDGLRADLALLGAARAFTALSGRDEVSIEDVHKVAEFALSHRSAEFNKSPASTTTPPTNHPPSVKDNKDEPPPDNSPSGANQAGGGASVPSNGGSTSIPPRGTAGSGTAGQVDYPVGADMMAVSLGPLLPKLGRGEAQPHHHGVSDELDWYATLADRQNSLQPFRIRQLHHRLAGRQQHVYLLLIDASGSMLHKGGLATTKHIADKLGQYLLQQRHRIILLCFRGTDSEVLVPLTSGRVSATSLTNTLQHMQAGGGTPLTTALARATQLLYQSMRRWPKAIHHLYIFTDGRCRLEHYSKLKGSHLVVIDTENRLPLKRAKTLAERLGGEYLPQESLLH